MQASSYDCNKADGARDERDDVAWTMTKSMKGDRTGPDRPTVVERTNGFNDA